ncbi:MAG: phosphate butyryltransferase, partial [Armatimonadia bacterium]|nr:phosphate butyryltransferase [Armatimonadia bacterium]
DMQATLDAAALAQMSRRGQFTKGIVDGPFALDNALSMEAAKGKKLEGPVAGQADILLVPDIEAGNMLAKAHVYLAGGTVAGVVVGASAPVVLTSRADSARSKLCSIALAVHMANMKRHMKVKLGRVYF